MQIKVKHGYNQIAQKYDDYRDQFGSEKYLKQLNQELTPASTILDLGCGSGRPVSKYLADRGHQVIGVDVSEEQIKLAKKHVPDGNFVVKDMSLLQPNEYQVNAVVSFYAIFHIPRETHLELFHKINSFLPIGGLLLVTMGMTNWVGHEDLLGTDMHWSHYDAKHNLKIIKQAGFEIINDQVDSSANEQHQVIFAKKIS